MNLPPRPAKARILIVEDELIVAENIARHLRKEGYEVAAIVDTGEDAIREALRGPIDLVLVDIMLQGEIDGITAMEIIHSETRVPAIYMTAYVDDTTLERAKRTDPYGYLVKPFKPHDLKANIEIALQKHRGELEAIDRQAARLESVKQQLEQLLHHDPLTNLLNWQTLQQEFTRVTEELSTRGDNRLPLYSAIVPVFCLGLDRFERLKNCFGQDAITRLLQIVARRIAEAVGSSGTVARTDADEFAILLDPVGNNGQTKAIARSILTAIAEPLALDGREVLVTASIGIANYPNDSDELETLFQCGRHVRQQLQTKGGNTYQFYLPSNPLPRYDPDLLILEKDLYQALEHEQLHLVYQPRVEIATGRIVGAEALTRWRHPERGNISPAIFIPLAEESGLIEPIGEWVLRSACRQLRVWRSDGFPPLQIAVNFSGYQLRRRDLAGYLRSLLAETDITADLLELELTESALIDDIPLAVRNMEAIQKLGIKIAIDDFGTGYSSLSHLHQFSFDILKLDRSFVAGIQMNRKNAAIAKAIITMAHQLNLRVVAEGVETPEELVYLRHHHCDEIQGYLFSPPVLPSEFARLVQKHYPLAS